MLMRRVIPCLDVRDGRIVKGVRFAGLRDAGDPVERAAIYEAEGADEIVVLDVSASPQGRATQVDVVRAVRAVLSIPLTVGGGVRSIDDASRLLDAGADKVSINTAAVERPELLAEIARRFGTQCTVIAIDAAARSDSAEYEVLTLSGSHPTGLSAIEWAQRAATLGAGEVLLTSFDRDGTRLGYDLGLIGAIAGAVAIPIIASGGAASTDHMVEALRAGADAVLAASIFHDSETTVSHIKQELHARGIHIRR